MLFVLLIFCKIVDHHCLNVARCLYIYIYNQSSLNQLQKRSVQLNLIIQNSEKFLVPIFL